MSAMRLFLTQTPAQLVGGFALTVATLASFWAVAAVLEMIRGSY